MTGISRRSFVGGSLATTAAWSLSRPIGAAGSAPSTAPSDATQPEIRPRSEWAAGLEATGPLLEEAPGDVRFLLVHHTETPNGYASGAVAPRLRNIFGYHTGTKGWHDIAYNFFVDAHGHIWEGRTGSLAGPVRGDATGGSQGFAQLCCFLGDHQTHPPTQEAITAMSALAAWLAGRYDIDLFAGPTITFTSRGSNRWAAAAEVTTDPIAGHRDMSQTACPGDAAYPLIRGAILQGAQALAPAASTTTTNAPPATTTTSARISEPATIAPTPSTTAATSDATGEADGSGGEINPLVIASAAGATAAVVSAGVVRLRKRTAAQGDEPTSV